MILFNQVNKILVKRNVLRLQRLLCTKQTTVLYPLESRGLLKIKGNDTSLFLQGLITNDMRHFEEGAKSMYAMFLNNKGRVLYDTLIHKWEDDKSFIIECDKEVLTTLLRHLKLYKLRRAVEFEDVSQHFRLWALMSSGSCPDNPVNIMNPINIYKDPRLSDLGYRVLSASDLEGNDIAKQIGNNVVAETKEEGYKYQKYKLGVSEGAEDLTPGSCFPLEVNCDYLHGVSFHKGCYIGQELTARVHHTGVVRKRIMPLKFKQIPNENLEKDVIITASDKSKSNLGKLKGFVNECGIGLVRIKEALDNNSLKIGNYEVEVQKPSWWPVEAPREKLTTKSE